MARGGNWSGGLSRGFLDSAIGPSEQEDGFGDDFNRHEALLLVYTRQTGLSPSAISSYVTLNELPGHADDPRLKTLKELIKRDYGPDGMNILKDMLKNTEGLGVSEDLRF